MMARVALWTLVSSAAVLAPAIPAARAQCRLCGQPSTAPDSSPSDSRIDLQVEAGLDFDQLVVLGRGDGSATLGPDGTREVSGTIEALSGRAMVGQARIHGEPNRAVRVELPQRIQLYSTGGGQISIDRIITDLPSLPRLDSGGNLSFRFGGRVRVSGNEEGEFRGDLPITAEYL